MKSNLQYIFDKIIRGAATPEAWEKLNRAALTELAIAIGAADRGVSITADKARLVADTVLAARRDGETDLRQLRAGLNQQVHVALAAHEPHASTVVSPRERRGAK